MPQVLPIEAQEPERQPAVPVSFKDSADNPEEEERQGQSEQQEEQEAVAMDDDLASEEVPESPRQPSDPSEDKAVVDDRSSDLDEDLVQIDYPEEEKRIDSDGEEADADPTLEELI